MSAQNVTVIKIDLFTKVVLTAIALFLGLIAVNSLSGKAYAMSEACGQTRATACYVWNVV